MDGNNSNNQYQILERSSQYDLSEFLDKEPSEILQEASLIVEKRVKSKYKNS